MKCFHFSGAGGQRQYGSSTSARLISVCSRGTAGIEPRRSPAYGPDSSPAVWGPPEGLRAFSFSELRAATRGFSRALLIGEGGFGCVYRGVVRCSGDGAAAAVDVAVKQMSRSGLQGHKEWITEVNILGVVKHPNLVKLVSYCAEDDERGIQRLLVYEFMPNKSLEDHLLARVSSNLSWTLRLKIACDAARGLAYLHEEMDFQLIFRDFKTSNVLLDEDFNAKLSDFGFARHGPAMGVGHISTSVVGTVGYAAPEYVHTGRLTTKSDVWSFGVVLYELITGRRSIDRNLPRTEQSLLEWVRPFATDPKRLHIIIDPRLEGECCKRSVRKLVALANKCLMKQPKLRPKMSQVVEMLDEIIGMSSGTGSETFTVATSIPDDSFEGTSIPDDSFEGTEIPKERVACKSRVFVFREVINLRNRSVQRLESLLGPGSIRKLARTWGYD